MWFYIHEFFFFFPSRLLPSTLDLYIFLVKRKTHSMVAMKLLGILLLVIASTFADDDDKKEEVGTVIGIDLGTTYSWYGIYRLF